MGKYALLFTFLSFQFLIYSQTVGLTQHDDESYDDGYVLFAPMGRTNTYLVDKCGKEVKTWSSNYPPGLSVYLMPDGNLLRTGNTGNPAFDNGGQGGIIEIIDWNDNIVWSYVISDAVKSQHHDVELLPNGNVLVIAWESKTAAEAIAQGRNPALTTDTIWSEQILEIQPTGPNTGNVVWEWHLWDHLIQDFDSSKPNYGVVENNPQLIDINYKASATEVDWIHFNSIDYNSELDQILVSAHVMSEVWIIDHSTTTSQAATQSGGNSGSGGALLYRWGNPEAYGQGTVVDKVFFGQHDAQWIESELPYGNQIMVFNNGFKKPGLKYSTVDVISPPVNGFNYNATLPYLPLNSTKLYNGGNAHEFYASNTSGVQMLPNSNLLISDGPSGRFFEVDSNENKVWEYVNPDAISGLIPQNSTPTSNPVFRCSFYSSNFSGFSSHSMTSGGILENENSISASCVLNTTLGVEELLTEEKLSVYPNPFTNKIYVNGAPENATYHLVDVLGGVIWSGVNIENQDFSHLVSGVYFLKISGGEVRTVRVVKG